MANASAEAVAVVTTPVPMHDAQSMDASAAAGKSKCASTFPPVAVGRGSVVSTPSWQPPGMEGAPVAAATTPSKSEKTRPKSAGWTAVRHVHRLSGCQSLIERISCLLLVAW